MSKLGHDFSRREALANARTNLVNDIELEVKNRVESYMNSTGLKESESIERVVTMVSRQTSSMTLKESKQISSWENPNDNFIYILVAIPKANIEKTINSEVQKALDSLDKI
jgi:BMFP domain-containing protein YqiC